MQYGEKLKQIIVENDMTYRQVSEKADVPEGTIKSICSGTTASPGFDVMCRLIKAVGADIDEFYTGVLKENKEAAPNEEHHHHHFHVTAMRGDMRDLAEEAIANVYATEAHKNAQKNLGWWRGIAMAELAFIVFMLVWDITHPNMGYIQYAHALEPTVTGLIDGLKRFM